MKKVFLLALLVPILLFLQGCDSSKSRGSAGESGGDPIVLISESIENCERYLGSPTRIHQSSPEARSYIHQGLHIQISYEGGESTAVVFRKAKKMGAVSRGLTDNDRNLVYKLCGTQPADLEVVLNNQAGKWETFNGLGSGQSYLLATDTSKTKSMTVVPKTQATLKSMQQYMRTK